MLFLHIALPHKTIIAIHQTMAEFAIQQGISSLADVGGVFGADEQIAFFVFLGFGAFVLFEALSSLLYVCAFCGDPPLVAVVYIK